MYDDANSTEDPGATTINGSIAAVVDSLTAQELLDIERAQQTRAAVRVSRTLLRSGPSSVFVLPTYLE